MKPKNIKEFQALVERYETITLQEIKDNWKEPNRYSSGDNTARFLTGFGGKDKCSLCLVIGGDCDYCVYGGDILLLNHCNGGINRKSFKRIRFADTPRKLLNAFRARAKHLRENYSKYLK